MNKIGKKELVLIVAGTLLISVNALAYFLVDYSRLLFADHAIPPETTGSRITLLIFFLTATFVTTAVVIWIRRKTALYGSRIMIYLAALTAMLTIITLSAPVIGSVDSFWYTLMERAWTTYGENPYLITPDSLNHDPLYPMISADGRIHGMVYGPLWVLIAAMPARVFTAYPWMAVYAIKIIAGLAYFSGGVWLYSILKKKRGLMSFPVLMLWLLSPAALFELINAGHNEGLLILFLSFFVGGLVAKRPTWALSGLVAAVLIKIWPVILIPALVSLRGARWSEWYKGIIYSGLLLLSFVPFWQGGGMIQSFLVHSDKAAPQFLSPVLFLVNQLGLLFGVEPNMAMDMSRLITGGIFLGVICYLVLRLIRGSLTALDYCRWSILTFFMIPLAWLQPWYLLTLIPFTINGNNSENRIILEQTLLGSVVFLAYVIDWTSISIMVMTAWVFYRLIRPTIANGRRLPVV